MKIVVIDGQGGSIGREVIARVRTELPAAQIIAVGTNAMATENMLKAHPTQAATGENPVVVNVADADVIIGPIGIVVVDSMYGEITARMSFAVSKSKAKKLLIPINQCNNIVVGVSDLTIRSLLDSVSEELNKIRVSL